MPWVNQASQWVLNDEDESDRIILNFGERLVNVRQRAQAPGLRLIMGGVLNEDAGPGANAELPRDVTAELNALGIVTTNDFIVLVRHLAALTD